MRTDACAMRNKGSKPLSVPALTSQFLHGTTKAQQFRCNPSDMIYDRTKSKETEAAQACRTD